MKARAFVIILYRIFAVLLILLPVVFNLINQGSLISALVYVPLISCAVAGLAIFIDGLLVEYVMADNSAESANLTVVANSQAQSEHISTAQHVCSLKVNVKGFNSAA